MQWRKCQKQQKMYVGEELFWRNISRLTPAIHLNVPTWNCIKRQLSMNRWVRGLLKEMTFSEKVEFVRGVHVTLGWLETERRVKVQPLHFEAWLRPWIQREGHSGSRTGDSWKRNLEGGKAQTSGKLVTGSRTDATYSWRQSLLILPMYCGTKATLQLKVSLCSSVQDVSARKSFDCSRFESDAMDMFQQSSWSYTGSTCSKTYLQPLLQFCFLLCWPESVE